MGCDLNLNANLSEFAPLAGAEKTVARVDRGGGCCWGRSGRQRGNRIILILKQLSLRAALSLWPDEDM